jgi:chromosome segregation ATPase|tara:strand:- start:3359 stop:3982 length:624 start_codon:yes stop_codon:yes gene_type:complete
MIRFLVLLFALAGASIGARAQDKAPDLSAFSPETRKEYEATQKFIDQTQNKITLVRTQTEARAKEIEALADRVSEIITKMSGQGEDNTALLSEIAVLNELLALERQTTAELRKDNNELTTAVESHIKENAEARQKHDQELKLKQAELADAQKRMNTALETATSRDKTNNVLVSNVEALTKETERLKKQVKILKENRYRPKRRLGTPK